MNRFGRQSATLMFGGQALLIVAIIFSFAAPAYVIKQYEPFESLIQMKNESLFQVKYKLENTKIKFDFSEETMGFSKYPFSRYYLQILKKDGKNVAIFAPKSTNNVNFAGRVIARENNESINLIMNKYESEHTGFRFENDVIVAENTSAIKKVNIISNVLYGIVLVIGIILWRKTKKHYLL